MIQNECSNIQLTSIKVETSPVIDSTTASERLFNRPEDKQVNQEI